jgi:hypothetical protein
MTCVDGGNQPNDTLCGDPLMCVGGTTLTVDVCLDGACTTRMRDCEFGCTPDPPMCNPDPGGGG